MRLIDRLLDLCCKGKLVKVCVGLHWTAVVAEVGGELRCGLASTVVDSYVHGHGELDEAGCLEEVPPKKLAEFIHSDQMLKRSIGMAAINALLPRFPQTWSDRNADEVIAEKGKGKKVVVVGNFPFIPRIREIAKELVVLEQTPKEGERPASDAAQVIPSADVVAITGMTVVNHTLDGLLSLCPKKATVLLLGPSTPLHPIMYDYGIHLLSGSIVVNIDPVLHIIMQAACFRQIRHAGVRLVTMSRD